MSHKATTLAVLHDEGQTGMEWMEFIQKMFTEELPEECRDMNLDILTESIDYVSEDESCNVNGCEYKLLLLNSSVLKMLKDPESSLRRSELLDCRPEAMIVLILGNEDDVEFLKDSKTCLYGFKDHDSYTIIQAKFPDQIFSDIMAVMSPMYVVPHPNILSSEDVDQHLTLISNKPYPVGKQIEYIIELSEGRKSTETTASLFNACTLLVQNPGHIPGVVTLRIFACTRNPHTEDKIPEVSRTQIGEDMKVWFQSDLDKVYSILESQSKPMQFLCQAMNISNIRDNKNRTDVEKVDKLLSDSFKKSIPPSKLSLVFGNSQQLEDQDGARSEYVPTLLHFSAMYGLQDLTAALLQCPGAVQAYGLANCDGDYPTNLAEKYGHWDLRDFMQTYMEVAAMVHNGLGDKSTMQTSQIMSSMVHGQYLSLGADWESEDIYMKMDDKSNLDPGHPGYTPMNPITSGLLPSLPQGVDYDFTIKKMLEGSEEAYEMLEFPPPLLPRVAPGPPPPPMPNPCMHNDEPPPPPPPRDEPIGKFCVVDPKDDISLLPKLPSDLSPAQQELIALQQKVKNGDVTINQAVFRFKEWERKHKERAASFQYQQENLQRIRNSLMRSRDERKQRGESTSIKISEPLVAGTSTYDQVLLRTRKDVMGENGSGERVKGKRPSFEKKNEPKTDPRGPMNDYGERGSGSRMRTSFKSSFGRPPILPERTGSTQSRTSLGSQGSSRSRSSVSSNDSSCFTSSFNHAPTLPPLPPNGRREFPVRSRGSINDEMYNASMPRNEGVLSEIHEQNLPYPTHDYSAPPVPPRDEGHARMAQPSSRHPSYGPSPSLPPRSPRYR